MRIELTKTDRRLQAVRFVAAAVSKEKSRYAIEYVFVQGHKLLATDGKRLHIATIDHDWDSGFYEICKNTKTHIILHQVEVDRTFPKWQDIISTYSSYVRATNTYERFIESTLGTLARQGVCIDKDFLCPLSAAAHVWRIYYGDSRSPINAVTQSTYAHLRAVIMPINMEYEEPRKRIVSSIYVAPEAA